MGYIRRNYSFDSSGLSLVELRMSVEYFRNSEVIEITVRDYGKKKIETHTCNISDSKKAGKIMQYLKDKYGFSPTIDINSSINPDNMGGTDDIDHRDKFNWWS